MSHLSLALIVLGSYSASLLVYRRFRIALGRREGIPPERLRALALHALHASARAQPPECERAARLLEEAEAARGLPRWLRASEARGLSRKALRAEPGPAPVCLWAVASLGYLTDGTNLEIVGWRSGRLLARALARHPEEPLLHVAAALRASVLGEPAETLAALGRALYHASGRGERALAEGIAALPRLAELSPGLCAQARQIARPEAEPPAGRL